LGLYHEKSGNTKKALDYYKKLSNYYPGNEDIQKKIRSLSKNNSSQEKQGIETRL